MIKRVFKLIYDSSKNTKLSSVQKMAVGGDNLFLNLKDMRAKYFDNHSIFTEDDLGDKDPIALFRKWMEIAAVTPGIIEANAMCLATASRDGVPSARYVLLKGFGNNGFDFFTNYNSRKGKDLNENPRAALTFYWEPLKRSVRIEGNVEKVVEDESAEYFHSRPRESQISACISKQSEVIANRNVMLKNCDEVANALGSEDVPRPAFWGGYRVIPSSIEFWQGQSNRLHDRIRFRKLCEGEIIDETVTHKGKDDWVFERLYP